MFEGRNAEDEVEFLLVEVPRKLMDVSDDIDVLAFDDIQPDVFPVISEPALNSVARTVREPISRIRPACCLSVSSMKERKILW